MPFKIKIKQSPETWTLDKANFARIVDSFALRK
jgi:hypothetical protein